MSELGYWNTRALCEPIRLLLHYAGEGFTDKRYQVGPPPDYDKSEWYTEKEHIGLSVPNLPYYKDGVVVLTQTNAILRYLAEKHGLDGDTAADRARAHMLMEGLRDWMNEFFDVTYCCAPWQDPTDDVHILGEFQCVNDNRARKFKELSLSYLRDRLPYFLSMYSSVLSANNPWVLGSRICYVDFILYEYLDQHLAFDRNCLNSYPILVDFVRRFRALPSIAAYLNSDNFKAEPLHNRYSHFHTGWVESLLGDKKK
mmetsp:Transcript_10510/g.15996  ORF Transcript_10510/g.15996 Transcript_10510/m.15996 type:complete len:256 (+) Transcript_10510:39-806(+)